MRRRFLLGGLTVVFAAALALTVVRCDPPPTEFTSFSYIPHELPRVFVSHHPLRALPGQNLTIRLTPDLRSEDGEVVRAFAGLRRTSGAEREERPCASGTNGTFVCEFTLPPVDADFIYDGHLRLAGGRRVDARASYLFTATSALGSNRLVKLREPVLDVRDMQPTYRVDTAWVRDPVRELAGADQYAENDFTADIETSVYEGILRDPVYRWRDHQLSFYVYSDPGFTSSYYSGFDTRCGQNPWPAETVFRNVLSNVETVGVLHRHAGPSGLEGTVASDPPPTAETFRDCAGDAVRGVGLRTFSVTGGVAQTGGIAKHEFGHAAFGLGDEYSESDATRRVPAAPTVADNNCCCVSDEGGPGTITPGGPTPGEITPGAGGSGLVPRGLRATLCVPPGGGEAAGGLGVSTVGLPSCTNPPTFPMWCGASPQAACPQLSGNCLQAQVWLGQPPPASLDTTRPNVFTSREACEDGRRRAAAHPGVEDRGSSLGECRELCGPNTIGCPCGQSAAWIVDTSPDIASALGVSSLDSMAKVAAKRLGGTCAWCVETSLCVRWQRARGDTVDAAWNYCKEPPINAAELERGSVTLARAVYEWIARLTKDWRF